MDKKDKKMFGRKLDQLATKYGVEYYLAMTDTGDKKPSLFKKGKEVGEIWGLLSDAVYQDFEMRRFLHQAKHIVRLEEEEGEPVTDEDFHYSNKERVKVLYVYQDLLAVLSMCPLCGGEDEVRVRILDWCMNLLLECEDLREVDIEELGKKGHEIERLHLGVLYNHLIGKFSQQAWSVTKDCDEEDKEKDHFQLAWNMYRIISKEAIPYIGPIDKLKEE